MWNDAGLMRTDEVWSSSSCKIWMQVLWEADRDKFELLAVIWWLVWFQRNKHIYGDGAWNLHGIISKAEELLSEFQSANVIEGRTSNSEVVRWKAPPSSMYKVNFDASWSRDGNVVGLGAVIRDCSGDFFAGLSKRGMRALSVEMAELMAAREAVNFALEAGFNSFILEGDNVGAINAIRNGDVGMGLASVLVADTLNLMEKCSSVECSFIKREGNKAAHLFAKHASSLDDCVIWLEDPPLWAQNVILNDSLT